MAYFSGHVSILGPHAVCKTYIYYFHIILKANVKKNPALLRKQNQLIQKIFKKNYDIALRVTQEQNNLNLGKL